jgi:hypothetical protein
MAAAIQARQRGASDPGESGQGTALQGIAAPNDAFNMPAVQQMYDPLMQCVLAHSNIRSLYCRM